MKPTTARAWQRVAKTRFGDWMQAFTGRPVWPLDPRPEDIDIENIASSLSKLCRFGGHIDREDDIYSVAEHSVYVSLQVPFEHAFPALLHDATEAYVVDVPRPVKYGLSDYAEIEQRNWLAIAAHFGIDPDLDPCIKHADNTVLLAERDQIMKPAPMPWEWAKGLTPAPIQVQCLSPGKAKKLFLDRFYELKDKYDA